MGGPSAPNGVEGLFFFAGTRRPLPLYAPGSPVPALSFRPAVEADLDRLIDIHTSAYPDPRGALARRRNFTANPRGALSDLKVAEEGGTIVAHGFLFPLRASFAGGVVPLAGIASVAVAPAARGRGIAGALLTHLHACAERAKACVTLLYPFRQGFYTKHGYAPVTPNRRLSFHPAAIPSAWRSEPGILLRSVDADGGAPTRDRAAIVNAHTRAAARSHGWVLRPAALWDHYFADERRVWVLAAREGKKNAVCGYVCWTLAQNENHAATRMIVRELAADDDATRRALLGAVGAQRDQVAEVELDIDASDPLDRALLDADRARFGTPDVEHMLGALSGGPMVRLVDVARGLAARKYASDGAIDLVVDGGAPLRLVVARGKAQVSAARRSQGRAPLAIDRAGLAALLYGGTWAREAARLGWARGEDATLARAEALFASPPFFALDAY
jgi:predicted acetyltransferase